MWHRCYVALEVCREDKRHSVQRRSLDAPLSCRQICSPTESPHLRICFFGQETVQKNGEWWAHQVGWLYNGQCFVDSFFASYVLTVFSSVSLSMLSASCPSALADCYYNWVILTGSTALGHNFRAIEDDHSPFVAQYNEVMDGIASPLWV